MNEQEWLKRYQQRFVDQAGMTTEQASQCAIAESFDVLSNGYEDDPEGAADLEMSYWSD